MSPFEILIVVVLVALSGFFSSSETAIMALSNAKIKALVETGRKGAKTLANLKKDSHRLLITILICNNIVIISAASYTTYIFNNAFGSAAIGIATGVMTVVLLVFGEITPKTIAVQNAEKISLKVAPIILVLSYILLPAILIFQKISDFISWSLGIKHEAALSEGEIRAMVTMGRDEGLLSKEAAKMMDNLIDFEKTKVSEVMTPKEKAELVDGNRTISDLLDHVVKHPYSRYPVFQDSPDNITGILDLDDILNYIKNGRMDTLVSKAALDPFMVSSDEEIDDLLIAFDRNNINMAIVVDQDENFIGIVTIEDIMEEIVGEVFDNSHSKDKLIRGRRETPTEIVSKTYDVNIAPGRFDTIASFVENKLKRIPKNGETIVLDKLIIEVLDADHTIIKKLKITKK